jgi:formate dehydrogenase assembly factor FdhD
MSLIASFGVPSAKAVEAARGTGMTLVTIAGPDRAIIYSGAERIGGLPGETYGHKTLADAVIYR